MRLVVAFFVLLFTLTLQAQDPAGRLVTASDAMQTADPISLSSPIPEYWKQDSLNRIQAAYNLLEAYQEPSSPPARSDTMLWSYIYLDESSETTSLTIIGTGDIMLGTDYPNPSYLPPGQDCCPLLRPLHDLLQSGDVLFGNLEGGFCSTGGTPKRCRDMTRCYVFRMPDHFLSCIVDAGYDVLSVANNHVNDFGPVGRASTAAMLDSAGLAYAGFVTHPWTLFDKGGVTYGFAAFAPNQGTMSLRDYKRAAEITALLDAIADVVIISFHGGGEGKEHQHVVRGNEFYLGENRGNVYHFAHTVVDAGADVVFGHGPHVTRALELYNNRLICYSLGNFATYGRFNLSGPNGIAPIVKVTVDMDGGFLEGEVVSVYQSGEGGPKVDPAGRAFSTMKRLTEVDFPDQELVMEGDGILWKR